MRLEFFLRLWVYQLKCLGTKHADLNQKNIGKKTVLDFGHKSLAYNILTVLSVHNKVFIVQLLNRVKE